ncbi:MAG: SAM-dependent methyltransferase [Bacteroidetes bacterium]|nr:MAG: SAM-dependent methyltransferase [Bacteroidota bacterium]
MHSFQKKTGYFQKKHTFAGMERDEFIRRYFTEVALNQETISIYTVRRLLFEAIQRATPKLTGKILDVGCGIMPYREYILQNNPQATQYIGCDFEDSLAGEYAMGKPDFFWDGKTLPAEDNSYDTVIATELLEHCAYPEEVLKEILRVLKPQGTLFFTVPFLWTLHLLPYDEYRYTPFSLKRHIENAGFTNIAIESLGNVDASLAQMIGIWSGYRPLGKWGKRLVKWLFLPLLRRLLEWDKEWSKKEFKQDTMPTGFCGFAKKN